MPEGMTNKIRKPSIIAVATQIRFMMYFSFRLNVKPFSDTDEA